MIGLGDKLCACLTLLLPGITIPPTFCNEVRLKLIAGVQWSSLAVVLLTEQNVLASSFFFPAKRSNYKMNTLSQNQSYTCAKHNSDAKLCYTFLLMHVLFGSPEMLINCVLYIIFSPLTGLGGWNGFTSNLLQRVYIFWMVKMIFHHGHIVINYMQTKTFKLAICKRKDLI